MAFPKNQQALDVMAQVQTAVEEQRKALASGLEAEMKTERERLGHLLDVKLAEIVSSFVLESLGDGLGVMTDDILAGLYAALVLSFGLPYLSLLFR